MAWTEGKPQSWTPTVTQSGAVTVTVTHARYSIAGEIAIVEAFLVVTGSGTAANAIVIGGQPTAIQPANTGNDAVIGSAMVLDMGTVYYVGAVVAFGATDFRFIVDGGLNFLGVNPSFALANTDRISFQATYEV